MDPFGSFTDVADSWWMCVLHSTWQSSLVALVAFAVVWLRRKRSASLLYAVLIVALLKFLVPPIIEIPVLESRDAFAPAVEVSDATRTNTDETRMVTDAVPAYAPVPPSTTLQLATPPEKAALAATVTLSGAELPLAQPSSPVAPDPAFSIATHWKTLLALMHLTGASLLALVMAGSYLHLRKLLRAAQPADGDLSSLANEVAARLHLRRPVSVLVTSASCAPMATGLFRRHILLPEALTTLETDEMRAVLAHELAHHRRMDLAFIWVEHLVTLLWWFNPVVWVLVRAIHRRREDCCDDVVLSLDLAANTHYCQTLLNAAKRLHRPFAPHLVFGCASKLHPLGQRITRIMDTAIRRRAALTAGGVVVVALMGLVLLPTFLPVAADADPARTDTDETRTDTDATATAAAPVDPSVTIEEEIGAHYVKADPEVQEYARWTARTFGRGGLWYAHDAFAQLTPEEREAKIVRVAEVLEGEYGRHLCTSLAEAGALKDARLLPGLIKAASYHREDSDYDCRPKWMAVSALGRQDDISVVPTLILLVDHGNQNTRMWARASLVRLTGQNFKDDKQAWGAWWNDSGNEPKIDLSQLKPWTPPSQTQATTPPPPAVPPSSTLQPAAVPPESQAVVDALPGELVFHATYFHRSRGSDLSAPSVVWIKRTNEGETVAASYLPAFNDTSVAYMSPDKGIRRYEGHYHGRDGQAPSARNLDIAHGVVTLSHEGGEKDGQTETLTVPPTAIFMPNSRPDPYTAHMGIAAFQAAIGLPSEPAELLCFDWDNTGKGMASYTIRTESKGKEEVTVPAGKFSATHYVETHLTFGDTWYKKRPGHVTDYWVLDNGVIVRILRHREPYELQLLSVETPAELPGYLGKATEQPAGTLKILSAVYGAQDSWVDLTEVLNRMIQNDTLEVRVSNELGGDPIYGTPKKLNVHYRIGEKTYVTTVDELGTLRLPESHATQPGPSGSPSDRNPSPVTGSSLPSDSAKRALKPIARIGDAVVFDRNQFAEALASLDYADVVNKLNPQMAEDENGNTTGITSDSLENFAFAREIGLKNGDVINTVNGITIDSDQKVMEFMHKFQNWNTFLLDVTRSGKPVVLTFLLQ